MAGGRRTDPEASRAAILEAARRCFSDKGFAGTSMSDIASEAGVTQSLIHHHFGSKDTLWTQVLTDAFEEYGAKQRAQLQTSEHKKGLVRGSMAAYFRFLAAHPDMLRLMSWAELRGEGELVEVIADLHRDAVGRMRAGQADGLIRSDVPAEHILTAFQGLARAWFEERSLVAPDADPQALAEAGEAYLAAAWSVFAGGVLAPTARAEVAADGASEPD